MSLIGRSWRGVLLTFALGPAILDGCSLSVGKPIEGRGIGSPCLDSDECHESRCSNGLCVISCRSDSDCPSPSMCSLGECHLPLNVSAFYDGHVTEGEGWTWGHDVALKGAASQLGYIRLQTSEGLNSESVKEPIEKAIAGGARVVVATSLSLEHPVQDAAERHPDVHFMVATASTWIARSNLTTYQGRSEAAYHVGGIVAAQKAVNRIGLILTTPHPRVISEANSFALGALHRRPGVKIEVRWLGYWLDYNTTPSFAFGGEKLFLEQLLTQRFMDSGCEVIAQLDDTARSANYIEAAQPAGQAPAVFSLRRNDRYGWMDPVTHEPLRTCLGSVFYDWTPQYRRVFEAIHRGTWKGIGIIDEMSASPDSVVGVEINPTIGLDDTSIRAAINHYAGSGGLERSFEGPYEITGQRDADGDGAPDSDQTVPQGETVPSAELDRICWFVKGMVEKADPGDSESPDIDARAPDGTREPPKDFVLPPGMTPQQAFDCHSYL